MSDNVSIPADVAKRYARKLRERYGSECAPLADLLDPRPLSLREELGAVIADAVGVSVLAGQNLMADAVLAFLKARIQALPPSRAHNGMCERCASRDDLDALFAEEAP